MPGIWTTAHSGIFCPVSNRHSRTFPEKGWKVCRKSTPYRMGLFLYDRLPPPSGTIPNPIGSFLKDAQLFDNVEFGVSPKDAIAMTASSRRLIELSFLALLDSGIDYRGRKVGSFVTGTNTEALAHVRRH